MLIVTNPACGVQTTLPLMPFKHASCICHPHRTRDGRRVPVRIPAGCLLLQAGKQLEWLTGGHITAGFHEVVCTPDTLAAADKARQEGRPLWRVSSTVFSHIASDVILEPLGRFASPHTCGQYPPTPAGLYVQQELKTIKLRGSP